MDTADSNNNEENPKGNQKIRINAALIVQILSAQDIHSSTLRKMKISTNVQNEAIMPDSANL